MAKKISAETLKDLAKSVTEAAEPAINGAMKSAEPVIEKVMEAAEPVLSEVKKRTEPATKAVKEQSNKAMDKVMAVSKDISEASAIKNCKAEFFIQYKDYEVRTEDIAHKIREQYVAEGHKLSDIKELQIYLKPEENTAYYVVNHKETGKFTY